MQHTPACVAEPLNFGKAPRDDVPFHPPGPSEATPSETLTELASSVFMTLAGDEAEPCDDALLKPSQAYWSATEFLGECFYLLTVVTNAGSAQHFLTTQIKRALELGVAPHLTSAKLFAFIAPSAANSRRELFGEVEEVLWGPSGERFALRFRNGPLFIVAGDDSEFCNEAAEDFAVVYPSSKAASSANTPHRAKPACTNNSHAS